ncbi:MAG: carboxypeptidase regulatory-like domain-containing protein [Candidatus Cloacimonetes bacterium]|nr:carboxypeptidase regulatory-like domain-containing protein [Candidatus Cloacimonadota bacterium]
MKKILLLLTILSLSCLFFASTHTIGYGTGLQYNVPYNGIFNYGWSKTIYLASEINASGFAADDEIMGLGYQVGNTPSNYTMINQSVYIRNTTQNTYQNNLVYPGNAQFTQVYQGDAVTNGSGWAYTFFDTPFQWDGVSNIEILWENYNGWWMTGYPQFLYHETTDYKTVYRTNDPSFPADNGYGTDRRPNIQLVTELMEAPGPALALNPTNENNIWGNATRLNWVSDEGIVTGYKLYFGDVNPPPFLEDMGSESNYIVSELEDDTQYFWSVVPYNDFGEATDCPIWTFFTSPPWFEDFGISSTDWPAHGWTQFSGIFPVVEYAGSQWRREPWINGPSGNNSASIHVSGQATRGWLVSPKVDVPAGGCVLKFDLGLTRWGAPLPILYPGEQQDDKFLVAVCDNPLGENPTILREWNNIGADDIYDEIPYTGISIEIPVADASGDTYFIFYAESTIDNWNNELFVDNIEVTLMPTEPILSFYPTQISFGEVRYGYDNPPEMVRVQNSGIGTLVLNEQNLYFTGVHASHFAYDQSVLPIELGSGEYAYIPVYSNSTVQGVNNAVFVINYNGIVRQVTLTSVVLPKGLFYIGTENYTTILPVRPSYFYTYSQSIYLQSEIDIHGTQIEKLSYYWTGPSATYSNDWTIFMGHTTDEAFDSEDAWLDTSLMSKVFEGQVPLLSNPGWVEIILDRPFPYNNSDNLVIAVSENSIYSDWDAGAFLGTPSPETRSLQYYNNEINHNPDQPRNGSRYAGVPNVRIQTGEFDGAGKPHFYADSVYFEDAYYGLPSAEKLLFVANTGMQTLVLNSANIQITGEHAENFAFDESLFPLNLESGFSVPIPIWVQSNYQGINNAHISITASGVTASAELIANVLPRYMLRYEVGERQYVNTLYNYPTPYPSRVSSFRQQYLYHASELNDMNAREGLINSIAFHVSEAADCVEITDYTIRIKHTNQQSFNQYFQAGEYQTVYHRDSIMPTYGWNKHDFDTPFMWDGEQNIIIELSSPLTDQYYDGDQANAVAYFTQTGFYSSLFNGSFMDDVSSGGNGYTSVDRADIRLYMTGISMGSLSGMVFEDGRPIQGAKIQVEQTFNNTYSGENGLYRIDYLPADTYTITVSKHNYVTQSVEVVITEDANTSQSFNLVGIPELAISENQHNFGHTTVNELRIKSFEISNTGGGELVISSIDINDSDAFSLMNLPNLPVTLYSNESIMFDVHFQPNSTGAHSAIISINDDIDAFRRINLSGRKETETLRVLNTIDVYGYGVNSLTIGSGNQLARVPLDMHWTQSMFQTIYLREELEYFDGLITGVSFYNSFVSNVFNKPVRIWMGSTNQTGSQNGWMPANSLTLVYDDMVYFPIGSNKIQITFPEPYRHDNTGNLVMLVQRPRDWTYYFSNDSFLVQTIGTNRSIALSSDGAEYDPNNMAQGSVTGIFPKTTFDLLPGSVGHITGLVKDENNIAIESVLVGISTRNSHVYSDGEGRYNVRNLLPNSYTLSFSKQGYYAETHNITVVESQTANLNVNMSPIPKVSVFGNVIASDTAQGLGGAKIRLSGYADFVVESNADGSFIFDSSVFIDNEYQYRITAPGYMPVDGTINLTQTDFDMGDIALEQGVFAPENFRALANASYTQVNLSWDAPQLIMSGMEADNGTANEVAKITTDKNSDFGTYAIWRLNVGQEENDDNWISLTDTQITDLNFVDDSWDALTEGEYRWAIKLFYGVDNQSLPIFSNALAKVSNPGSISGFVRSSTNQQTIAGAKVIANDGYIAITGQDGHYNLTLPAGTYNFTVSHEEYNYRVFADIIILAGEENVRDFTLNHVDIEDEVAVVKTQLHHNYPNPFNPETTINYSIKEQAKVSLQVFNLKGQLVRTLVNETKPSGNYSVVFNAVDRNGNKLSSGLYFYRLQTNNHSQTRKMMLME